MATSTIIGKLKSLYDAPAAPETKTPKLVKDEILSLLKRHDNGWLEIYTSEQVHGFVPPAWVEEIPTAESPPPPPPDDPVLPPPPPEDPIPSPIPEPIPEPVVESAPPSAAQDPQSPTETEPVFTPAADPEPPAPLESRPSLPDIASARSAPAPTPAPRGSSESLLSPSTSTSGLPTKPKPRLSVSERPAPPSRSPKPARKAAPKPQPRPPVRQAETALTYATPSNGSQDGGSSPPPAQPNSNTASPQTTSTVEPNVPQVAEEDAPPTRPAPVPSANRPASIGTTSPAQSSGEGAHLKPRPKSNSVMSAFASQLEATLGGAGGPAKPRLNKMRVSAGDDQDPSEPAVTSEEDHARPHRPAPAPPPGAVPVRDRAVSAARKGKKHHPSLAEIPPEPKSAPPKPARLHRPKSSEPGSPKSPFSSPRTSRGVTLDEDDEDEINVDSLYDNVGDEDDAETSTIEAQPSIDEEGSLPPTPSANATAPNTPSANPTAPNTPSVSGMSAPTTPMHDDHPGVVFGFLERKPVREGGKEARARRWTKYFAAVNQHHLELSYSKKDHDKGKKPAMTFGIIGMEVGVEPHPKRKEVILFGNDTEKMFLSCPESEIDNWLRALSPQTSPEGMTSRRQTNAPAGKEKVKSRLNRWLAGRAKKSDLVDKGILQNTLFGGTISKAVELEAATATVPNVPIILVKCIAKVEATITELGVYRVSGNASDVQTYVAEANKDVNSVDIANVNDVHVATGLLKLYFRELDEPAFTDNLYQSFVDAGRDQDRASQESSLKKLCKQLPVTHRATLKYLFEHLMKVAAQGAVNKMQVNNLGIVFGPTLLRESSPSVDSIVMDAPYQSSVVELLMQHPDWFL
eukprot:m.155342 g.155342  ORF g.155342 m.155342 type:complete len:858 (-) comp16412_c0_seq1:1106-3679(-)